MVGGGMISCRIAFHQWQQFTDRMGKGHLLLNVLPSSRGYCRSLGFVLKVVLHDVRQFVDFGADEVLSGHIGIRSIDRLGHHKCLIANPKEESHA